MKIALLSYEYPPETGFGGIGTYTFYHANALARLGHEVHVFAGTDHAERRTYRHGNVTVTRLRKVGPVERLARSTDRHALGWFKNRLQNASNMFAALRRQLAGGGFDVVEMPECGAEGALLNHLLDLPSVVRLHSPAALIMPTYETKSLDRSLTAMVERLGMTGARSVTSCSHWLASEVRTRLQLDRPIDVIPNGIDLTLFDRDEGIDIHERFDIPRDQVKVLFANRLEERKGIHIIRDIAADILEQHPEATLVLAGADAGGVVDRELRPRLAERGVEDRLRYVGKLQLPEVRACLKQADVFLLPSTWENAPYSLLEAMSAGKAIVAADCGGVPEMLRHEVDGLIARTNDADSFRRALDRLLKNAALRRRFGRSARQRIEARFTDEVVARRSVAHYQWALGAPVEVRSRPPAGPRTEVGPDNWFQAWWLRDETVRQTPVVARSESGTPLLAGITLDQQAFVLRVLERAYWERAGRSDAPEAAFLEEVAAVHRQCALVAQRDGLPAATERLALPALTHPIFDDDISAVPFLDELWRLRDTTELREWLGREITSTSFVERATARVSLRRLAITAARVDPRPGTYAVLQQVYRAVGTHARVVQQDNEFIQHSDRGTEFAAMVREMGLHTSLQRPAVFAKQRRGRGKTRQTAVAATVTVLIPAYRHQAYIAEAMRSVLAQDHQDLRLLVVDDRSPDGTLDAARAVQDPRVEVRVNAENLGLGGSIDAALDGIDTPYVALLNSDDMFASQRLSRCLAALAADTSLALAATTLETMDDSGRRLTPDNSCIVDIGPNAHAWVRWYDNVRRQLTAGQWHSLAALLQHNHLATSSNIVCRTDFLVHHRKAFRDLKYCLDWMLFLLAALDDKLVHIDEPLLGYRLHDANTVWFDEAGRADYVHEVNRVVARTLQALLAKRRGARLAKAGIVEEIAGLLRQHVARHGETDGFELFLATLIDEPTDMPAPDAAAQADRLALEALQRKQLERFLGPLQIKPWDLAQLHRETDRLQIDRHLAWGFIEHSKKLEPKAGRLASQLETTQERVADADAMREEFDAQIAEQLEMQPYYDHLQQRLPEVIAERDWSESERLRLDAERLQLLEERSQLLEQRSQLLEQRSQLQSDGQRLQGELQAVRGELHASQQRLLWKHTEYAEQRRELVESYDYRLGRLLLRKMRLFGPFKTVMRLCTHARVRGGRSLARLGRLLRGSGSKRTRVVLSCGGAFPSAAEGSLAEEARTLVDAGIDVRVLCWSAGSRDSLAETDLPILRRRHVLSVDASLFAADRRYFAKHRATALAELEAMLDSEHVASICTFARSAEALGAGYLHGAQLGKATLQAWAASRLLDVPFGVSVAAADLTFAALNATVLARILRDARIVTVDGAAAAADARELAATPRDVVLKPPMVHRNADAAKPAIGGLISCVGPRAHAVSMVRLADAVALGLRNGADLRIELLTPPAMGGNEVEAFESLVRRARELGIAERIAISGSTEPARVSDLLLRASALLELDGFEPHRRPGISVAMTEAMANGVPIIGSADALAGIIHDRVEGLLVAGTDAESLASALVEVTRDKMLHASLARAARARFDTELAPGVAGAAFCARVKELLGP